MQMASPKPLNHEILANDTNLAKNSIAKNIS